MLPLLCTLRSLNETCGGGLVFWHPKGAMVRCACYACCAAPAGHAAPQLVAADSASGRWAPEWQPGAGAGGRAGWQAQVMFGIVCLPCTRCAI